MVEDIAEGRRISTRKRRLGGNYDDFWNTDEVYFPEGQGEGNVTVLRFDHGHPIQALYAAVIGSMSVPSLKSGDVTCESLYMRIATVMEYELDLFHITVKHHFSTEDLKNLIAEAASSNKFKVGLHLAKHKESSVVCSSTKLRYPFQLKQPHAPNSSIVWNEEDYYKGYRQRREKAITEIQFLGNNQPSVGAITKTTREETVSSSTHRDRGLQQYMVMDVNRYDTLRNILKEEESECLKNSSLMTMIIDCMKKPASDLPLLQNHAEGLQKFYLALGGATEDKRSKMYLFWIRFLAKLMEYYLMFMSKYAWDLGVPLRVAKDYKKHVHIIETLIREFMVGDAMKEFFYVMSSLAPQFSAWSMKALETVRLIYMVISQELIKEFWNTRLRLMKLSPEKFLEPPTEEAWQKAVDAMKIADLDTCEYLSGWLAGNRIKTGTIRKSIPLAARELLGVFQRENVTKGPTASPPPLACASTPRRGDISHMEMYGNLSRVSDQFFDFFCHATVFFYKIMCPAFMFHYNHLKPGPAELCRKAILKSEKIQGKFWMCLPNSIWPENPTAIDLSTSVDKYGALFRYLLAGFLNCHLKDRYRFFARNMIRSKRSSSTRDTLGVASTKANSSTSTTKSASASAQPPQPPQNDDDDDDDDDDDYNDDDDNDDDEEEFDITQCETETETLLKPTQTRSKGF
jgi:hypothetical protein